MMVIVSAKAQLRVFAQRSDNARLSTLIVKAEELHNWTDLPTTFLFSAHIERIFFLGSSENIFPCLHYASYFQFMRETRLRNTVPID